MKNAPFAVGAARYGFFYGRLPAPANLSPVYSYQDDVPSAAIPPVATTPVAKPASTSVLPFLGDEARKRGYELPEPFGLNINYMNIGQNINVDSINFNGSALGPNGEFH